MFDVLAGDGVEIAFSEGKVINAIQYIGFSHSVVPYKAVDLACQIQNSAESKFL